MFQELVCHNIDVHRVSYNLMNDVDFKFRFIWPSNFVKTALFRLPVYRYMGCHGAMTAGNVQLWMMEIYNFGWSQKCYAYKFL